VHPAQPNFFVVGAAKTGTTSLYHYLDQHPAVFMSPIKEPCFFAPEVVDFDPQGRRAFEADAAGLRAYLDGPMRRKRSSGIVLDWQDYLKLFKHVRDEIAVGEASVSYLPSTSAAHAIRTRLPEARIVVMLRDPADRLGSHFAASRVAGATDAGFIDWIEAQLAVESKRNPPFGAIWTGRYAEHLARYLSEFPEGQVRTCLYEDYTQVPSQVVADIFAFLGVDPSRPIDVTRRYNVTLAPRRPGLEAFLRPVRRTVRGIVPARIFERVLAAGSTPRFVPTPDDRARAIDLYREDIHALEGLIGRRLDAWLDPHSQIRFPSTP